MVIDKRGADNNIARLAATIGSRKRTAAAQRANVAHRSVLPEERANLRPGVKEEIRIHIGDAVVSNPNDLAVIVDINSHALIAAGKVTQVQYLLLLPEHRPNFLCANIRIDSQN